MIKLAPCNLCFYLLLLLASFQTAAAQPNSSVASDQNEKSSIARTSLIVREVIEKSYPELKKVQIKIKTFDSRADYFRSRFSLVRFITFRKLDYLILVNPRIFGKDEPTDAAVRAIIAHELAHVAYYERHNRFELLGLMSLLSNSFTVRFERGADLEAIRRGYSAGLKDYRQWLYQNIPPKNLAAKKRDYFSPEEIELILEATAEKPALFDFWRKKIPRNAAEINADSTEQQF